MPAVGSYVPGYISADFLHNIPVVKLFLLVSTAEIRPDHCNFLFSLPKNNSVSICITYYATLFPSDL